MANKKFSEFTLKTDSANVDFVVGYDGSDNVRIAPSNLSSGGASSLNGLTDCSVDTSSLYVGTVPSSLSGTFKSNTTLGIDAAPAITTSNNGVYIGSEVALIATAGVSNSVLIGSNVQKSSAGASDSVIIGSGAGESAPGDTVVSIGKNAGRVNTSFGHISIGGNAGFSQTSGTANTNVGYNAGQNNLTGGNRLCIGYQAGRQNTGGNNTFVGFEAGNGVFGSSTGGNNTALGYQAGNSVTTGQNLTMIGYDADASSATATNEITLGDANIATLRCQVQTISALSDSRDKTNIQPSTYGLDLISQLHPVTFDWNMRDGAKVGQKDLGFIAQELQEVDDENLQLVYDNNPDRLEASYGRLIPVLVQAIKELKAEVELLKA